MEGRWPSTRPAFPRHEQRLPDEQRAVLSHPEYHFIQLFDGAEFIPPAVGQADQGLDALIDAGEESEGHQRQVGHNAVGRHPQRPRPGGGSAG